MRFFRSASISAGVIATGVVIGVILPRATTWLLISLQAAAGLNIDDLAPAAYLLMFAAGPLLAGGCAAGLSHLIHRLPVSGDQTSITWKPAPAIVSGAVAVVLAFIVTVLLVCY